MKLWVLPLAAAIAFAPTIADAGGGGGSKVGTTKNAKQTKGKRGRKGPASKTPAQQGVAAPNAVRSSKASEIKFGDPIKFHNISIVPVTTKRRGNFQHYTLLETGLKNKTLTVRELAGNSGEAQVSSVEIRNTGDEPVYLLGGEMILGGKQDRIISQDTVIKKSKKWVKVDVFCVEQGRWNGQNMKFSSGKAMADVSIRRAAMSGSQSEVWNEVKKKNVLHGTTSKTQTYRRTIQNSKVRKKVKPYIKALRSKLPKDEQLAGLVFGINGKIHVADIFGNPVLFDDLSDKLLSAYVLEALGHKISKNHAPVSSDAADAFITKGRKAKPKRVKKSGRAKNIGKEEVDFIGAETVDEDDGETIRESYMSQ
jgi:hypothetical protein